MRTLIVVAVALLGAGALGAQTPSAPLDWNGLRTEILDRYRALVRIDSTPGRETLVVNYLKQVL
jgi:hypothetical protein